MDHGYLDNVIIKVNDRKSYDLVCYDRGTNC